MRSALLAVTAAISSVRPMPAVPTPAQPAPALIAPAAPAPLAQPVPLPRSAPMAGPTQQSALPEGEKPAVPSDQPTPRAQKMEDEMRKFVEAFHKDLMTERPDLFQLKMKTAAASEFSFYRAFPQLFYAQLKKSPEAEALAKAKKTRLAGDLHAENAELVERKSQRVLQPNDFDDTGVAPVALEIARVLGSAGVLAKTPADRSALIQEASEAYKRSAGQKFSDWVDGLKDEKSVKEAKEEDRKWAKNAGPALADKALAERLLTAVGLNSTEWSVHDRMGAGLSSIGLRRYLFVSKDHGHVFELKELRPSALLAFTGEKAPASNRPRLDAAFKELRDVSVDARTLAFDGKEWSLRRREATVTNLDLDREMSAARVLAGLGAQLHRSGASKAELADALKAVTPELVERSLQFMSGMRDALRKLLRDGAWGFRAP